MSRDDVFCRIMKEYTAIYRAIYYGNNSLQWLAVVDFTVAARVFVRARALFPFFFAVKTSEKAPEANETPLTTAGVGGYQFEDKFRGAGPIAPNPTYSIQERGARSGWYHAPI